MEYEVSVVTLEDKKDYMVVKDMMVNGKRYCFLAEKEHPENVCVRRIDKVEHVETFVYLDSEEELTKVMTEFLKG